MGEVGGGPGPVLGVLELLDRDGQWRVAHVVHGWPLRIGRALDNELLLADPHVASHHLSIASGAEGLELQVLDTDNGIDHGPKRLRRGEHAVLREDGEAPEFVVGRTRLRLRLPGHALAPERPLATEASRTRRFGPIALVGLVLLAALSFGTWLDSDPDNFVRALGAMLLTALVGTAVWCGAWALLSKTFTRQSHFGWHLKVFLTAGLAWLLIGVVPELLAFALSWPWAADFGFIAVYAIGAAALYFHLLAVEPARPRLLRAVALVALVSGVGLALWFNQQRNDRLGAELYMSHLFPPALRLARPVPADRFIDDLDTLQAGLDRKAKEPLRGDGGSGGSDDEE